MEVLSKKEGKEFIFQYDGVNDHFARVAQYCANTSILFDKSAGTGIVPDKWPYPEPWIHCGYAGGLGPQNFTEEVKKILTVANGSEWNKNRNFWVDMERNVRTLDDSKLDMKAVRNVLKQASRIIPEFVISR